MDREPILFTSAAPLPAALARLRACPGAALLVDACAGSIVAATPRAVRLLALTPTSAGASLDSTMPALQCIRTFWSAGSAAAERERLVFWTPRGVLPAACRLVRTGALVLVQVLVQAAAGDLALDPSAPLGAATGEAAAKLSGESRSGAPHEAAPPERTANPGFSKLAHELRTPLSAIAAAAEIMKEERLGPLGSARYKSYATDILDSARHALGLVERTLATKSAANAPSADALEFAEIAPSDVLETSVSQVRPLAEKAGIDLVLEVESRLPHLVADATSLRQIVLNLITNALKFTAPGGRVTVSAHYRLDGPLLIEVADTGKGMSRRDIARFLDPRHPPREEPREGGGRGIGLPLVRTLAEANGGRLSIESAPGKGTRAAVTFAKDRVVIPA